ncbi:Maf family protein [Colwellia sp. MEBiC06753]
MSFVLASQSPRRQAMLAELGYQFNCVPADIDESVNVNEAPEAYVQRLALEKAACVAKLQSDTKVVLGSDTTVVYQQRILGKPESFGDFAATMQLLSGQCHQVYTAIAAVKGQHSAVNVITTDVWFKPLSAHEIANYWRSGEPQDKAGGYGIQGLGAQFVTKINGSYSAVVGLPIFETVQLLQHFGINNSITG